jgi:hypothetical protein
VSSPRARWRRLAPYAIPALVFAALVLAIFWRVWTPIDGARRAFAWDSQWEYWGDLQFQVDAVADGEAPLWNPWDRAGYPFHADIQAGTLYPPQWPLIGAGLALGGAPWWLITVKVLLHLWLCGLGVYAFLRRRGNPAFACYAGGALVLLSYPVLHNSFTALTWSFAWVPWLLLAVDAWAPRPTPGRGVLVALPAAMAVLAGGMAALWYGLLVAIPYGVWAVVHARRADPARCGGWRRHAASLGAGALIFAAITAAQLDATASALPETVRASRDLDFFGFSVFGGQDLIGFAVPRMAGENTYLGVAAILWAAVLVAARPDSRTMVLGGVTALGVLCALGSDAPFLSFFASLVDPFEMFRRAHRYLYVLAIPFAILAAEGLAHLAALDDAARRRRTGRAVAIAGGAVALACLIGWAVRVQAPIGPDVLRDQFGAPPSSNADAVRDAFAWGVASALVATALTWLIVRSRDGVARRRWVWIAVVALVADLWFARAHKIDRGLQVTPVPAHDAELAAALDGGDARLYDHEVIGWRPGTRLHVRDFGGYEDDPLALRRYAAMLGRAQAAPRQLGHVNVRWAYEARGDLAKRSAEDRAALRPIAGQRGGYELAAVAPWVAWYDAAELVADERAALDALLAAPPGSRAVLEAPTLTADEAARAVRIDLAPGAAPTVTGQVTAFRRNAIAISIDAPADGVVVVNEAWFPRGWEARVDGAPARIVPANALLRGVLVGPGPHLIEMRYRAARYGWLALVELAGLAAAAIVVLRERRRERAAAA